MTEAGIVSTLKRLCKWSGHGGISGDGLVQLLSVRIREELEEGVLEGILEVVGLVVGLVVVGLVVGEGVGRCDICTDRDIRLLGLMRIDLLFEDRELLWIGWNMERDMFGCCVFPSFFVRMKLILGITLYFVIFIKPFFRSFLS